MKENLVMAEIEAACSHYRFCILPRNPKTLYTSVWTVPDPDFHAGVLYRQNVGGFKKGRSFIRLGLPGLADFSGWRFKDGRRLQIEAKSAKGVLSLDQIAHRDLCLKTGVLWGLARSYEDCVKLLESWGLKQ